MNVDDSIFGIDARFAAACDDAGGVLTEVGFFNAIGENPDVSVVGDLVMVAGAQEGGGVAAGDRFAGCEFRCPPRTPYRNSRGR